MKIKTTNNKYQKSNNNKAPSLKFKTFITVILELFVVWDLLFVFSSAAYAQSGVYPQLDISGFKKWELKQVTVAPMTNYFTGLSQLGGYSPTYSGGPWQERLQLRIVGQLNENLSVGYDLEQQPENPDRYDVTVKYYNHELTFGDFNTEFTGNEFASASKYLNGVNFKSKDSWYDLNLVPSAKLKSQTQNLVAQNGNNTKGPYSLGHGSLVENSEYIELNGNLLTRTVDYTIDYFEGKITFNQILTANDVFKYSYEYTNILDLFFPTLSKRDFFGFQNRFTIDPESFGKPLPQPEPQINYARDTFPSNQEENAEAAEEESAGRYKLSHPPLVKFSEKITFMGQELKNNEDYVLRYNEGEIRLLTRFLPTAEDPMVIEYRYYETSTEVEVINGINSRGPYLLANKNVVPDSERIEVDSKLFVRGLDYSINNNNQVTFSQAVSSTSQIKVKYTYNVMVVPNTAPSKYPKEIKAGVTYLRESAKAGSVASTNAVIESFSGSDIIDDKYCIYLSNLPAVPSGESEFSVTISVGGRTLTPEVDYTFPLTQLDPVTGYYIVTPEAALSYRNDRTDPSDGYYTGTIKLLDQGLISADSTVLVNYNYYKSIVGKYAGSGDGTRGPYYFQNVRNIVPGTETVQVWTQGSSVITTYTRNSSFEANAGATGYSINYNESLPSITFNNELDVNKNFQVIYQYVPPSGFVSQDLSQSVTGVDSSFKIGEIFKVDGALAYSEIDNYISRAPSSESFSGNNTKNYILHAENNIIENSDLVYVNDKLLNKDIDYFFSYTQPGQVTFYYITPATQDAIRVDYDYQSIAGGGSVSTRTGNAFKVGAETRLFDEKLTLSGSTKKIDSTFTAMGGTAIAVGSSQRQYDVKFNPGLHSFYTNFSYKENQNPIGANYSRFNRSYDNSAATGFNPNGLAAISFDYRNYRTIDDAIPGSATSNDTAQDTYGFNLVPVDWQRGGLTFGQKYDLKKTFSRTDTERDSGTYTETNIDFQHLNWRLKLTDRLEAGYDFQASAPTTRNSVEAITSLVKTTDNSYSTSIDLTFGALQKWTARFSLLEHRELTLAKNAVATNESITTNNATYHMDLVPIAMLTSSLDHNRQERTTLVANGVNPLNTRTALNINLNPISWFSTGWSGTQSENIPETGIQNKTTGNANTYTANWKPISFEKVTLVSNFTLSDNRQGAPTGNIATPEVITLTNSFAKNLTLTLTPISILPISIGYSVEDYQNRNNHPATASQIATQTRNTTTNIGATLTPTPKLTLSANYNEKVTMVLADLVIKPYTSLTKTVNDYKASYQVFNWGTAFYNLSSERNKGEIQAGAAVEQNLEKNTHNYGVSFTFPSDNPVLSSFVLIASNKIVEYKDYTTTSNNFTATLFSVEGTLNF